MELEGLTGHISFDSGGFRSNFTLDIVELKKEGLVVDHWANYEHNFNDHIDTIKGILTSSALVLEEKLE